MASSFSLGLLHHQNTSHYSLLETASSTQTTIKVCGYDQSSNLGEIYKVLAPFDLHKGSTSIFIALDQSILQCKRHYLQQPDDRLMLKKILKEQDFDQSYHHFQRLYDLDPKGVVYQHYQVTKNIIDPVLAVFKKLKIKLDALYYWQELAPLLDYYSHHHAAKFLQTNNQPSTALAYFSETLTRVL